MPIYHHLTETEQSEIITAYRDELQTMKAIATKYHVSRQAIFNTLRKAGVETCKAKTAHIKVSCTVCGTETTKRRCLFRRTNHHFCSETCYHAWLKHGNGNPLIIHRHSAKQSRQIIAQVFPLQPTHIVHHEDRNQYNTDPSNLKVFANQGDHIRYHRGFPVIPLWP